MSFPRKVIARCLECERDFKTQLAAAMHRRLYPHHIIQELEPGSVNLTGSQINSLPSTNHLLTGTIASIGSATGLNLNPLVQHSLDQLDHVARRVLRWSSNLLPNIGLLKLFRVQDPHTAKEQSSSTHTHSTRQKVASRKELEPQ